MADMRGKYKRVKKKHDIGRPVGSKTVFSYEPEELKGLPKECKYLSPAEIKILRGLMDPEIQKLSTNTEKCEAIGVSRAKFYAALKNPTFLKIFNEQSMAIVRSEAIPILRSSIKFAKEKSSNYRDRAMLFQMLGFINNDGVDININLEQKKENPFEHMSLDELKALAQGYMQNDFVNADYREVKGDE